MAKITSKKLESFSISWLPAEKMFIRTVLMIQQGDRGGGIGSTMNVVTEAIAKKLGCKSVTVQAIVDTSLEYWKKKPDYVFDPATRSATKAL